MENQKIAGKVEKFAAFYFKNEFARESLGEFSDGGKLIGMSLDEFYKRFSYVGTFEGKCPDTIFSLLQDGGGGLSIACDRMTGEVKPETRVAGRLMQDLLINNIGHTSMSTGDVLVNLGTGEILICAACGWDKILVTGMRPVEA